MTHLVAAYRAMAGEYNADDEYRAHRFYEGREFGGLAWAIEHHDEREVDDSIQKVLKGPLFPPS